MDGVTRREFLKWAGLSGAGAVAFSACGVPESALFITSPVNIPEDLVSSFENWYATACEISGGGEGILVRVVEGKAKKVEGNPNHPITRGKSSAVMQAQVQSVYHPDRIHSPMIRRDFVRTNDKAGRGDGEYGEISWADAIGLLGRWLGEAGQNGLLMTNPLSGAIGGVAARFAQATGLRHLGLEPMEQTTVRQAMRDVFGAEQMPTFDIAHANTVLSFGANWLGTWMSPVQFSTQYGTFRGGTVDERRERGYFVHAEPRFSLTSANADRWLPVNPGWEGVLALSIAHELQGLGLASPFGDLSQYAPATVSSQTGVSADWIHEVAVRLRDHGPSVVIGGGSAAAHVNGQFNMRAIYGLNVMLGNLGQEGGVLFNPDAPIDGLIGNPVISSFRDWKAATEDLRTGGARMALVRGANPVHALASIGFRDALLNADFIVGFSNIMDDTTALADLILPETDGLEQWGIQVPRVGPGYQVVSFQQPVVRPDPQQDPRAFGDTLLQTVREMQGDAEFPFGNMRDLTMSLAEQLYGLGRGFPTNQDVVGSAQDFWNAALAAGGWWDTDTRGQTPNVTSVDLGGRQDPQPQGSGTFALVPFEHNSLDDGRLAYLPWMQHLPDPITTAAWQTWVEINIDTAKGMNLTTGDVVELSGPNGTVEASVYASPATPPNVVAAPVAYGHTHGGRYAEGRGVNIFGIVAPAEDAGTGAFAWAASRVNVTKTGRRKQLPTFEGAVTPVRQLEEQPLILVVKGTGGEAAAGDH